MTETKPIQARFKYILYKSLAVLSVMPLFLVTVAIYVITGFSLLKYAEDKANMWEKIVEANEKLKELRKRTIR